MFFFFFQAEDGIRDFHVTGVQTCALPIFRGLLDPELANDVAADVEPEDVARLLLGVGGVLGKLYAAGLAATSGEDLGLDDDRTAERRRGGAGFLRGDGKTSVGDRDADAPEELLPLVLVEIHGA